MSQIKRFNLAFRTPDGELPPLQVDISDEPIRLPELVPLIHEMASRSVGLALGLATREGKELSCRAGCGACCRQLVPVAPAEVFYLVEKMLDMPVEKRKVPLSRFDENEKKLVSTGLIDDIRNLGDTGDNNAVAEKYFALGLACPFLENGSCSIHPWRPIACREFNVTSPAERCVDPFHLKIESVPLHRRLAERLDRLCADVAGLPPGLVPMPLLFDYYETYREVSKKTFLGIELFERMVEVVFGG
jgi:Fe-S-cluster containining protein